MNQASAYITARDGLLLDDTASFTDHGPEGTILFQFFLIKCLWQSVRCGVRQQCLFSQSGGDGSAQ